MARWPRGDLEARGLQGRGERRGFRRGLVGAPGYSASHTILLFLSSPFRDSLPRERKIPPSGRLMPAIDAIKDVSQSVNPSIGRYRSWSLEVGKDLFGHWIARSPARSRPRTTSGLFCTKASCAGVRPFRVAGLLIGWSTPHRNPPSSSPLRRSITRCWPETSSTPL